MDHHVDGDIFKNVLLCQLDVREAVFNLYGVNSPQLAAMGVGGTARVRHSRMLLAGIQANFGLDPRLKHSGVTTWGKVSEVFLIPRSLPWGDSFSPTFLPATLKKNIFSSMGPEKIRLEAKLAARNFQNLSHIEN